MADLLFVTIQWDQAGGFSAEAFGPWTVRDDGSHLNEITEFLKRWHAAERRTGMSATIWRAVSPDEYDQRVTARAAEGGADG